MLDYKNLPIIEAVAEVLQETKAALTSDLQQHVEQMRIVEQSLHDAADADKQKHNERFDELQKLINSINEERPNDAEKLLEEIQEKLALEIEQIKSAQGWVNDELSGKADKQAEQQSVLLQNVIDVSAELSDTKTALQELSAKVSGELLLEIQSIEQSKNALQAGLDDLRTAMDERIVESMHLSQEALDVVASETVAQLSEEIAKRTQEIVECSEALDALNESQLKIFDTTKALQAKQDEALLTLSTTIDARLSEIKDGTDGVNGQDGSDGRDGEKGLDGERGNDGRDRPIIEPMLVRHGDKVDKNTLVAHGGGLFMTSRKANGSPEEDAAGYNCIVNGVADITFEQTELRKTEMRIALSDGLVIDHTIENHAPIFRGTFKKDVEYQVNDIVIKDFKTLIKVAPEGDRQWQAFVFPERGEKGDAGGLGEKGADGVGIKDIFASDSNLLFEMSDGQVHTIELALPDLNGDFDGAPIRSFRGYYDANQNYSAGEIVRMDNSLWLATERTSDFPSGKSGDWVQMIASSVGGGEGGGTGTQGPAGPMGPAGPTAVSTDPNNTAVLGSDGLLYVPATAGGGATVIMSDVAPLTANEGDLWFNTDTGGLFVYYNDGSSTQWVQVTASGQAAATVYTAETPPTEPVAEQLWLNSATGSMFALYDDGSSTQWIEIVSIGASAAVKELRTEIDELKALVNQLLKDAQA